MATSPPALRAQLQTALQNLTTGNLADTATQLLATLGVTAIRPVYISQIGL